MNTVDIPGKCFERQSQTGRFVDETILATADALFVASLYIWTWLWVHLQMAVIQMMPTAPSDPNEAGLKRTTATQGDSSCERNVPLWEPPGLNPYTGVFYPYMGAHCTVGVLC